MGSARVPPYVAGPLRLRPFRALTLAPRRVGDPASARAFARPYRGVRQRLEGWQRRGFASQDSEPAVYLHEYSDSGLTVRGLVGCLDLSRSPTDPVERRVFPHEGVHPRQVRELASRMASMRLNPAPILLVHRGPASLRELSTEVRTGSPHHEYTDHAGQQHRVWAIRAPVELELIESELADARLLVADGHHRYAAYVSLFRKAPSPAHGCGLAMVIDHDETPLFLGAIHRLLHGIPLEAALAAAEAAGGRVDRSAETEALAALSPDTFVLSDGDAWATVKVDLPIGQALVQLFDGAVVTRLRPPPSTVAYAHALPQAMEQVRPGRVTAALLPAVDLDLVMSVVRSGGLLPEKATSFQPKPSVGAFIRLLDE